MADQLQFGSHSSQRGPFRERHLAVIVVGGPVDGRAIVIVPAEPHKARGFSDAQHPQAVGLQHAHRQVGNPGDAERQRKQALPAG